MILSSFQKNVDRSSFIPRERSKYQHIYVQTVEIDKAYEPKGTLTYETVRMVTNYLRCKENLKHVCYSDSKWGILIDKRHKLIKQIKQVCCK